MMLNPVSNLVLAISNSFFVFEPIQSCDLFLGKKIFPGPRKRSFWWNFGSDSFNVLTLPQKHCFRDPNSDFWPARAAGSFQWRLELGHQVM